jgi:hypothetical protein
MLIVVALFGFAFIAVLGYRILGDIRTDALSDGGMGVNATNILNDAYSNFPGWLDEAFVIVMVLIWIGVIVASFMIDTHPIFMAFSIIMLIFVWYVGAELANAYDNVLGTAEYSTASFPKTTWVMERFVTILVVMGFTILVALFGKSYI